jgi:hypothetical protein
MREEGIGVLEESDQNNPVVNPTDEDTHQGSEVKNGRGIYQR